MASYFNEKPQGVPRFVERFNVHQRYQHLMLFVSMFFLFLTGFPIKYGSMGWAKWVVNLFGGFSHMFTVHLVAAVIMLLSGLYHIIWLIGNFSVSGPKWTMVPGKKFVTDAIHHALYLIGIKKEPPRYDRFTYLEQFEYLAVGYGIIVMGLSGAVLWFPDFAAALLPRYIIHMFRIAHSNEALVAFFAVAIGHFFWVHINPDVFPTSKVWINGKISKEHLMHEHPLEYERIAAQYGDDPHAAHPASSRKLTRNRLFMGVELIIYIALILFLYAKFIPKLLS